MQSKKKLLILFLFGFTSVFCVDQINTLKNIYHHRGVSQRGTSDCGNRLELGSVVFYFSAKPIIKRISSQLMSDQRTKNTYSMSGVRFQKGKVPTLPIVSKYYTITMQEGEDAMHLVVTYNPRTVAIEFDTFDSISLQKGVVIHFVDCNIARTQLVKKKNNKQKTIVIDCGHGGSDPGAIGCFGVKEKDIVLVVGLRVAQLLKKSGIHAVLTRSCDVDVALDERTSFANRHNADLFISIHANSAKNISAQGIDTFCMHAPLLHHEKHLSDNNCGNALQELIKTRADESNRLARTVHQSVITNVKKAYPAVVDRTVKYEVAQILLGSHMPAILIELGFVSHEQEAKRLRDQSYQLLLARSISNGIIAYLKE